MKSDLVRYLQATTTMIRQHIKTQRIGNYVCLEHFVMKNGRFWKPNADALPEDVRPGPTGQCFRNAANLALDHRNKYIYVEGYATSLIPVMHAWCVHWQTGEVIDPTWTGEFNTLRPVAREYYGIAINTNYLCEMLLNRERYGIIDAWELRWPMLTAPEREWRHPVNDLNRRSKIPKPVTQS